MQSCTSLEMGWRLEDVTDLHHTCLDLLEAKLLNVFLRSIFDGYFRISLGFIDNPLNNRIDFHLVLEYLVLHLYLKTA